jgi:PAS domain S-box-containing protein
MPSFRALIENGSDVVSLMNPAGQVLYASASSARVFGYLPKELVGQNTFDLIHPEDRSHSRRAVRGVLARPPGPRQVEARVHQKNGDWCWVESTISNLLDEPRVGALVVNFREIGAKRAAREQDQRHAEELAHSRTELDDCASAVAHDLREPLRISLFMDLLLREAQVKTQGPLMAQLVVAGVARISALLEELHASALRGFDEPPQPVDLGHVVAEALTHLEPAIAASDAQVTVDRLPWVQGYETHLLQVLQTLIVNAIKYRSDAPSEIHVTAERLGPDWLIKVKDNGIGIVPEDQERVFSLLKLHGPETPGGSIGLATCRKIVEALGGAMWVESGPGCGSTFCFTIEDATEEGAASALPDSPPVSALTSRGTQRASSAC